MATTPGVPRDSADTPFPPGAPSAAPPDPIEAFCQDVRDRAFRHARSRSIGRASADDIAQDVALELYGRLASEPALLTDSELRERSILVEITKVWMRIRRSQARADKHLEEWLTVKEDVVGYGLEPEQDRAFHEAFDTMDKAVNKMNPGMAQTFQAIRMGPHSIESASQLLGRPIETVRSDLRRAGMRLDAEAKSLVQERIAQ